MVTLVSGLLPCLDRDRGESDWLHFAHLLRASGLPVVIYGEPGLIAKVDTGPQGAAASAVLRPLTEDALRRGLWLHEEFQALTEASGHGPEQGLARMARLRALGWLHHGTPAGHTEIAGQRPPDSVSGSPPLTWPRAGSGR